MRRGGRGTRRAGGGERSGEVREAAPAELAGGLTVSPDLRGLGVAVGHATDEAGGTGLTVVRGEGDALRGAVATIGRATGTREFLALEPTSLADRVDAVMLTGGSAYGLDAAAGVMRWHEERERGFPVGQGVVPIVPAAVIFDLGPCGRFDARPTARMAYDACERATSMDIDEGSVGAGTGATVGKAAGIDRAMKGGVGVAAVGADDLAVGAVSVVNAFGDVRDSSGAIIAGARGDEGFADSARVVASGGAPDGFGRAALRNTTISVVIVNVALGRVPLGALARAATAALYRRITPVGTKYDGDVVFALCPRGGAAETSPRLEQLAVDALEDAIERAVRAARGRDGIPGLAGGTGPFGAR